MDAVLLVGLTVGLPLIAMAWVKRRDRKLWALRAELAQEDNPSTEAVDHLMERSTLRDWKARVERKLWRTKF